MKLLDSSVAIDHLRRRAEATELVAGLARAGELGASEIVRFELVAGALPEERFDLEGFFSTVSWLPVDEEIARVGGALARRFRRSHSGIDDADYLIAATAFVYDAELLTTNVRHFPMLDGLAAPY